MQPKVSMVIPCFNKAGFISEMLDSVIAQEWDNIELVIVNDGSTDGTREIIEGYRPKLAARGFETVIIDQDNRGVASAVYEGLTHSTGEFLCQADADDSLDPQYVSEMAGRLADGSGCDWVVCDYDRLLFSYERHPRIKKDVHDPESPYSYPLAESLLLERVLRGICNHMFRKSYFLSCHALDLFPTEAVTQETQVLIPLALGGVRPQYIRRPLYRYIKRKGSKVTSRASYDENLHYLRRRNDLTATVLSRQAGEKVLMGVVLQAGNLIREHYQMCVFPEYNEREAAQKLVEIINGSRWADAKISAVAAEKSGFEPLARYFGNRVVGHAPVISRFKKKPGGRMIAYAAYGRSSRRVRYGLVRSDIRPDVFWDSAAKPGDSIDGVPVKPPDFKSLLPLDCILVLLRDVTIISHVSAEIGGRLPEKNVFQFYEVMDHLAEFFYGGNTEADEKES